MSEQLHEYEFLLLLLDLANGAPIGSDEYKDIEQTQEQFLINKDNLDDIRYTIKQSTVIDLSYNKSSPLYCTGLNDYINEQSENRMWPFDGEENE